MKGNKLGIMELCLIIITVCVVVFVSYNLYSNYQREKAEEETKQAAKKVVEEVTKAFDTIANRELAKERIGLFGTALDTFRLDVGRYPTSAEGLSALHTKPGGVSNWDGPYLSKAIPKDSWGHEYVYTSPGSHGEYDLVSYGLDGASGGEGENADVVSWE